MSIDAGFQSLVAPDGTTFQVLSGDPPAYDAEATQAALQAYLQANPGAATPVPAPAPVSKLGFIRLLTGSERAAFVVAQDEAAALTAADEASPTPQVQGLIGLKVFLMMWDALRETDTITLSDPDTQAAIGLFLELGIVPTQARVNAILAGQEP